MDLRPVRDAYSLMSEQYVGLLDGGWPDDEDDTALVRRHLTGLAGPVLDLGGGHGHWTAYLLSFEVEVTGVDQVPEFIAYARATYTGPVFRLGSMDEVDVPEHRWQASSPGTRPSTCRRSTSMASLQNFAVSLPPPGC